MSCVNADGNEVFGVLSLNSQYDWYLIRLLKNFKKGTRCSNERDLKCNQTRALVAILTTDQAIEGVVAYIQTHSK